MGAGSWMKRSRSPRAAIISCGGGGTNLAVFRLLPDAPIQFWLVRNSPGLFSAPRVESITRGVDLSNEPERHRQLLQTLEAVVHRIDVVHDLHRVRRRRGVQHLRLEFQNLREGRLGALDLRREHRLLPDVHQDEEVRVGKRLGRSVQPPERAVRLGQEPPHLVVHPHRRIGRQTGGNERPVVRGLGDVGSGSARGLMHAGVNYGPRGRTLFT